AYNATEARKAWMAATASFSRWFGQERSTLHLPHPALPLFLDHAAPASLDLHLPQVLPLADAPLEPDDRVLPGKQVDWTAEDWRISCQFPLLPFKRNVPPWGTFGGLDPQLAGQQYRFLAGLDGHLALRRVHARHVITWRQFDGPAEEGLAGRYQLLAILK